jgi:hypothetical protein
MQYTKVETPLIIRQPVTPTTLSDKSLVSVSGNIKALIPFCREILSAEPLPGNNLVF